MVTGIDDIQPAYVAVPEKKSIFCYPSFIQGPKHPGIDIDVCLEPLMQEMETLWKEGINIYDGFAR